jgi:hypothetical protein
VRQAHSGEALARGEGREQFGPKLLRPLVAESAASSIALTKYETGGHACARQLLITFEKLLGRKLPAAI